MRRGDRLFETIEILRPARSPISAQAIGEELGVAKRTVYRDVAALIAQGVPIMREAGVGYVLGPGFHMPPLMLTPDEIEAVTLGVMWVRTRGEPELALAAEKLITKLETVAPARYRTSFLEPTVSAARLRSRMRCLAQPRSGRPSGDGRRSRYHTRTRSGTRPAG